jgi:hypothetical protein
MVKRAFLVQRCAAVVFVLAIAPGLAQAYIDPGSGAYMVQAMFALIGAIIFYARHPMRSLKSFGRWVAGRWRKDRSVSTQEPALEAGDPHDPLAANKANDETH